MKHMKKIFSYILGASLVLGLVSCDKLFDNLEGDLSKMSAADLTSTEAGLDRLMSTLYQSIPMGAFSENEKNTPNANETSGGSAYSGGVSHSWDYTYVRDINFFIKSIEQAKDAETITPETYNSLLGEAKFIRAYYYFGAVRRHGGVPIVTEPLDDKYDGGENAELYIPRSTEKETWDFVLAELDEAASLLPDSRSATNYRATKWSALGLKSRVALWAASECRYWKNAGLSGYKAVTEKLAYMDANDAAGYYQQCIDASEAIINSNKFSLYKPTPASVEEAVKNLSDLFQARHNEEFIFGRSYVNGITTNSNGVDLKNSPNQIHGSGTGVWKFGCYGVTLDLVDQFDNYGPGFSGVDGTIKTLVSGNETNYVSLPAEQTGQDAIKAMNFIKYDTMDGPFKDKDARFKAFVIYPGIVFRSVPIVIQGGIWEPMGVGFKHREQKPDGSYELKDPCNGALHVYDDSNPNVWMDEKTGYFGYGAISETYYSGFYYRGHTNDGSWYTTGFGLRKFLNPDKAVSESQNPWYDIRYTEILLNYCEAQVELGGTNAGKSKEYLNAIRRRAFFQDQRDATLENVLKERRVELCFEEDYARTLYRRRAFFNRERDLSSNPNGGRKHALIPILDMREGTPKYFFVRANHYDWDTDLRPEISSWSPLDYYRGIPNWNTTNKLTPNPSQE